MINQNRIFIVTVIGATIFVGSLVAPGVRSQDNKMNSSKVSDGALEKQIDDAATPVVDLANPDYSDRVDKNSRRIKNARHDNSGPDKTRAIPNVNGVLAEPAWRSDFSDLPVAKSDLIVEAVMSESHAFLSNDRTGIYSEFTLVLSKPPKFTGGINVNVGDRIVAERSGGKVRYPSGQTIRWRIGRQGIPLIGKRYLLFLAKADEDSYKLLTAYEIQGDKISALDGSRTEDGGRQGASIFDRHNGQSVEALMSEVDMAIKNSRRVGTP